MVKSPPESLDRGSTDDHVGGTSGTQDDGDGPGLEGDHEPPCEWDTVVSSLPNLFDTVPHHVAQLSEEQQTPDGAEGTVHCLSQDNTSPRPSERLGSW